MIDAREPKANNCPLSCLFYTEKLSGAAERLSNSVLWDLLSKVAEEGQGKYQTIWVCSYEADAVFVRSLIIHRICMPANTIHGILT
jgi:hypothetical protein